jgi:uncharacterized lipoprotein YajG
MIIVLLALVLAVLVFILILLVLVGAQREAPWTTFEETPPTPLAGFARAVLGVYVRKNGDDAKPEQITALAQGRR